MNDNVVKFQEALKRAEEQEHQHEHKCEHCTVIEFVINNFMKNVTSEVKLNNITQEVIAEELYAALDFIWDRSKVASLRPYVYAMMDEIDGIDGYEED
jgi:hypothetical protein